MELEMEMEMKLLNNDEEDIMKKTISELNIPNKLLLKLPSGKTYKKVQKSDFIELQHLTNRRHVQKMLHIPSNLHMAVKDLITEVYMEGPNNHNDHNKETYHRFVEKKAMSIKQEIEALQKLSENGCKHIQSVYSVVGTDFSRI
jgi:hypothetical protein